MAIEAPLWMQAGEYPARLDRHFIEEVMRRQNRVFRGLIASQRAAGGNFTIDVSPGTVCLLGTSQNFQGMYFVRVTAIENVPVPATPAAPRTDTLIVVVNDPQAGGDIGDNAELKVIQGTILPANSLGLATISRTTTEGAILNNAIIDIAPRGEWSWTVGTAAPSGRGIPGDLYVVC